MLPPRGGERALGELLAELGVHRLAWDQPMWEMHVIEGLAEERFAVFFKIHHALIDGVGGVMRFAQSLPRIRPTSP